MDIENYQKELRYLESELDDLQQTKRNLNKKIKEAEQALENAKSLRSDFDNFVAMKKKKTANQTRNNFMKSFKSFINKATNLLSGGDYLKASEKVDEISSVIKKEINKLDDDLDYCNKEIKKIKTKIDKLKVDYSNYLKMQQESEAN